MTGRPFIEARDRHKRRRRRACDLLEGRSFIEGRIRRTCTAAAGPRRRPRAGDPSSRHVQSSASAVPAGMPPRLILAVLHRGHTNVWANGGPKAPVAAPAWAALPRGTWIPFAAGKLMSSPLLTGRPFIEAAQASCRCTSPRRAAAP